MFTLNMGNLLNYHNMIYFFRQFFFVFFSALEWQQKEDRKRHAPKTQVKPQTMCHQTTPSYL